MLNISSEIRYHISKLGRPTSSILQTKSQGYRLSGSGEKEILRVSTKIVRSRILMSLYAKFDFYWPNSYRGEDV